MVCDAGITTRKHLMTVYAELISHPQIQSSIRSHIYIRVNCKPSPPFSSSCLSSFPSPEIIKPFKQNNT